MPVTLASSASIMASLLRFIDSESQSCNSEFDAFFASSLESGLLFTLSALGIAELELFSSWEFLLSPSVFCTDDVSVAGVSDSFWAFSFFSRSSKYFLFFPSKIWSAFSKICCFLFSLTIEIYKNKKDFKS